MSDAEHTTNDTVCEPWTVKYQPGATSARIVGAHSEDTIGEIYVWDDHEAEGLFNARLAAAAPLMLEALKAYEQARCHDQDEEYDGCDDDCDKAVALWQDADRLTMAALAAAAPTTDGGEPGE